MVTPAKKTGPEFTFQGIAKRCRRTYPILLRLRIEFFLVGCEQHVDPFLGELVAVILEGAGITLEVFVRAELQAVHEDARDHRIAVALGQPDQRQMALVQITHGRHECGAQLSEQLTP